MKVTSKLALNYIKKNKSKSKFSILGIALTMLIFTITFIVLCSYQEYITNIMRYERNYEAEFANITYKNALEIAKDKNIKEISIIQDIGTSEENFSKSVSQGGVASVIKINISAFDENAIKNNHIKLVEGRFPTNTHEIVLEKSSQTEEILGEQNRNNAEYIGQKIEITINEKKEEYLIVGMAENLPNGSFGLSTEWIIPAITYFDKDNITEDTLVDVSILTNNIQKIYKTTDELVEKLNLYETEEEKEKNLTYHTDLLYYELVNVPKEKEDTIIGNAKEFEEDLRRIIIVLITIIAIVSILTINMTFRMIYREEIQELGMLSSIGMSKKQRLKLLLKETIIIATIGIFIGFLVGTVISLIVVKYISILAGEAEKVIGAKLLFDPNVKMYVIFPPIPLFISVILTYGIAIISSIIPIKKMNKISPIEAIKYTIEREKVRRKDIKVSKIISKLLKQEGILAYKNVRRNSSKYKSIMISIIVSIVLTISINQLAGIRLFNEYGNKKNEKIGANYMISVNSKEQRIEEDIINKLKKQGLINSYIKYENLSTMQKSKIVVSTSKNMLTKAGKILAQKGRINIEQIGNETLIETRVLTASGDAYDELLKKVGIEKLNDNECILLNKAFGTKYEDKDNITKYKEGETIVLKEIDKKIIEEGNMLTEDKEANQQEKSILNTILENTGTSTYNTKENINNNLINNIYNLKIVAVAKENIKFISSEYNCMTLIINSETYKKIATANNTDILYNENNISPIYIDSDNPNRIDEELKNVKEIDGTNYDKMNSGLEKINSIEKIVIYTFLILILLFSCLNIYNIIHSSIILRKKELAMLKSIGMSNKQINKMLFLEGIFYGLNGVVFGIIISLIILYLMYNFFVETSLYDFYIPILNIIACIMITIAIIFLSIMYGKKKLTDKNIVDIIKNENN